MELGISIKNRESRSASWNLFTARQSHVIYWGIAAKLELLSQRYHLPLWHTGRSPTAKQ